ncbi:MAG: Ig-like domain-containing protein, partial [Chloroflexota bacterium]|nr:Ig-like domain-containing protein [Chloroflexota bacterium]
STIPGDDARSSLLHSNNRGVCARCHVDDIGQVFMHGDGEGGGGSGGGSGCDASGCHGYSGTHATHTLSNSKGPDPSLVCEDCHDTDNYPLFLGGNNLNDTDVCDGCHSPGGSYNGVNDPVIGAKFNWDDGVYNSPTLRVGKEKWCAGCHDGDPLEPLELPANSRIDGTGIYAPSVIGDEGEPTDYGIGYGFYKTGHGVTGVGTFPATGRTGADLGCLDCHDASKKHIDEDPRTYQALDEYLDYTPESGDYQDGYRIRDITSGYAGQYPMHMPRTGNAFPPGFREDWEFALCFECHNRNNLFNGGDPSTGAGAGTEFRAISNGDGSGTPSPTPGYWYSMHDVHTWGANGPWGPESPQYDSDFDGIEDSRMSCTACHNVHGSSSPAMIRDGKLVGVTGLGFQYTPTGTTLPDSAGGAMVNGAGQGTVGSNGICNMCHAQSISYDRPPLNPTTLSMTGMNPSNGSAGVALDSNLTFALSDSDDGLDWTTFSITMIGDMGYSETYTDIDTSIISKTGDQYNYDVTVDPDVDFAASEVISVTVNVDNLDSPPQSLVPPAWSFTTSAGGSGNTVTLHPSGAVAGQDGGFSIMNGTWEDALDSNDGDASYAHRCCGPPGYNFTVDLDDPTGLDSVIIDDVTVYVYARYLEGSWPDAEAASGNVDIGYNTGGSTTWSGEFTTDTSGNYNLLAYNLGPLSVTDLNNLQVTVERSTGGGTTYGPYILRVTEVYVEVDYTP